MIKSEVKTLQLQFIDPAGTKVTYALTKPKDDLDKAAIDTLFTQCDASEGYALRIDLDAQTVTRPEGVAHTFAVDAFRKHCLLNGLDDIGLTLNDRDAIHAFEARHRAAQPWLFEG